MAERLTIALACTKCESRNYRTTTKRDRTSQLTLKKFCRTCKAHTLHKETK